MEDFRSKSCKVESFYGNKRAAAAEMAAPKSMEDLRCYSANYTNQQLGKEVKMKKSKSTFGFGAAASSKSWSFIDPELQRKKRVASYKVLTVEGKMKGSLRKSFKWIKNTYSQMINGWE